MQRSLLPRRSAHDSFAVMANGKIVWVLGAGFSKALGAPLLPGLLTRKSVERARFAFGTALTTIETNHALGMLELYDLGREMRLWLHAEEFIEALDLVVEDAEGRGKSGRNDLEFLPSAIVAGGGLG
jgi:hypothetical protein